MPFVLRPLSAPHSRRAFLGHSAATAVALSASRAEPETAMREVGGPPAWFALLADTHIAGDPEAVHNGQNMSQNLGRTVQSILAEPTPPGGVFVDGDLALLKGEPGDYLQLVSCLEPIRRAGVPVYLTLGNHDDRDAFRAKLPSEILTPTAIEEKQVAVVQAGGVRFILLDSLDAPNVTPGVLGTGQLAWLKSTLDAHRDLPCILFVHHNLTREPEYSLTDTPALREVIDPRPQVKAVVFGHTHRWERAEVAGIHWINLPAVAYPFAPDQPLGWCRFEPSAQGGTLELRTIGGETSKSGEKVDLIWRKV